MKKTLITIFILLAICLQSFIIVPKIISSVQDAFLYVGSTRIRDDSDSNRVRFNKRIAMELNAQPFDLSSDFTWSTSSGLTFASSRDSMSLAKLTINKDSIAGETTWNKNWTLKRASYNLYDSTVLIWYFKNTRWSTTAEYYAINNYQEYSNAATIYTLSTSSTALDDWILPHDGTWRVEAFFDYKFALDSIINWGTEDSITVYLDYEEPATHGKWIKRVYNPYNTKSGEAGTGYTSIITTVLTGNLYGLTTENAQNTGGARKCYIYNIRLNYELIK